MAFNAGTVKGTLELNVQKFKKSVDSAKKSLTGLRRSAKGAGDGIKSAGSNLKKWVLGVGAAVLGVAALRKAFTTLKETITRASRAQQEYEASVQGVVAGLVQIGAVDIAGTTKELEDLATVIQDTTAWDDTQVLGVAKSLAAFGVEADKLGEYTKIVLDFSRAFGTNFTTSARAFGQAMAGNSATLARYFPQVRGIEVELLKQGEAFRIAGKALAGYSEIADQTTEGSLKRMKNVLNDLQKRLGKAFNEFLGPTAERLKEIFRDLVDSLDDNSQGFNDLVETMRAGFEFAHRSVQIFIEAWFKVKAAIAEVQSVGASFQQAFVNLIANIMIGWNSWQEAVWRLAQSLVNLLQRLPFLSEGFKQSLAGIEDLTKRYVAENENAIAQLERMKDDAAEIVRERKKEAQAARDTLAAIQNNEKTESAILNTVTGIYNIKVKESTLEKALREQRAQELADRNRLARLAAERNEKIKERRRHLDEILGITRDEKGNIIEIARATDDVADAARDAAGAVGDMADEFGRAASAARDTASAAASAGAAAGGGPPTLSASRTVVSRTALDFSDPFRAVGLAQQAQETLGRISRGGKNVYVGMAGVNAARAFADAVTAEAEAAVDRAIADYTATIISELNQAGVLDPAERSRIIRQRIAEAQRMGVLPDPSSLDYTNLGIQ